MWGQSGAVSVRQGEAGLQGSTGSANPGTLSLRLSPDREVHHVVDLVPPNKAAEGEALELDDEDVGQPPQHQLLGGLAVLLALGAVPGGRVCSLPPWGEPQVLQLSPAPRSPTCGAGRGDAEGLSLPCQGQASTILLSAGIAPCWLMASLPSAQGRPAQRSWLPQETACRPGQLLGNPHCCLGPRAGTHPAAFLTMLPPGPGLRAW